MMAASAADLDETAPLLGSSEPAVGEKRRSWLSRIGSTPNRVVLAGFLITLSFSVTQVPLFYLFHLMECDIFYGKHPPFAGPGDRCSRNEITAGTATQFSILGISTTFCGTLNLFVSGWMVKRYGPRRALVLQTVIPALRVLTQILGVQAGGEVGIIIIQATQVVTILGGPAGYVLVINTIAGEVAAPLERTALFGRLQGCIMLGMALGLWLGGLIGDHFGIRSPFFTAFALFCAASAYARTALPYIAPEAMADGKARAQGGVAGFLAPLRVLAPQKLRLASAGGAVVTRHYGVFFLCVGIFFGVVATGYAPTLIQMYATAEFGFSQGDNGYLMAGNALMRAFFLILLFPRIIARGRAWFAGRARARRNAAAAATKPALDDGGEAARGTGAAGGMLPTDPRRFEAPSAAQAEEGEPVVPDPAVEKLACQFDLFFLRWSLLVDGLLTAVTAFATRGWHVYLAAFLLPFGSGSAPAAKGVITEMCPRSQRTDALNAVTLVENIARLTTLGLFGFIFAALSEVGQSYLTFYCNAAIAVVGMAVLLLSHFPPDDSTLVEEPEDQPAGEVATD